MNIEQAYTAIIDFAKSQQYLFNDTHIELEFGLERPPIGDWADDVNIGIPNRGDGIGNKSGVYFFSMPDGEIVYIGKASQNNLHERVWDHLKTPQEITLDKKRYFHKHKFIKELPLYADEFTNGSIRLHIVTVSEQSLVSLLEVYLQTLHFKKFGKLPALNKQIG